MKKAIRFTLFQMAIFLIFSILLISCAALEGEHQGGHEEQEDIHKKDDQRGNFEREAATPPKQFNELATEGLAVTNTKNVTRLNEDNPIELSILVSQTVWPATHEENQPGTVILAPVKEWRYSLAALTLVHHPNDGPLLFWDEGISENVMQELNRLQPKGNSEGIQVLVVGDIENEELAKLDDYSIEQIQGVNAADLASKIDEKFSETIEEVYPNVIIGSSEEAAKEYTISVSNWIAHMNESVLYVNNEGIPSETAEALEKRGEEATIFIVGPEEVISAEIAEELKNYGNVHRIEGGNPVAQSLAFATYKNNETGFGWGISKPGHGFVFSSTATPELAIAAAPFAHLGKHAPLIWLPDGEMTQVLYDYMAKVKPAFSEDPTEGPYNHGYIIGSFEKIPFKTQGILDEKMEIASLEGDDHHAGH